MDTVGTDPTGMEDMDTMDMHTAPTRIGPSRMGAMADTGLEITRWHIATSASTTGIMSDITPRGRITTLTMGTIGITMVGATTMAGDGVAGIGTAAG